MKKFIEKCLKKTVTGTGLVTNNNAETDHLPKIGFVIDATGSRAKTWQAAQEIQAQMLDSVHHQHNTAVALRVTFFRSSEVLSSPWHTRADDLTDFMQGIKCKGGLTQITKALAAYLSGCPNLKAVCLIGDTAEIKGNILFANDNRQDLETISKMLGARGVRVFTFLDGHDASGREVFQMIARNSGGAFASFGSKLELSEMCRFVASFAALDALAFQKHIESGQSAQGKNLASQLAITYQKN
jgi:hypothetical protein